MSKFLKRIVFLGVGAMMLVVNILPIFDTYATTHGSGEYGISASVDSNADWLVSFTIDGEDWVAEDSYLSNNGEYL